MAAAAAAAVGGGSGGHGVSGTIVGGGGVGLRLGRGPELMRRLCAINQQFATSVMEDYIRPIGEDATQCIVYILHRIGFRNGGRFLPPMLLWQKSAAYPGIILCRQ